MDLEPVTVERNIFDKLDSCRDFNAASQILSDHGYPRDLVALMAEQALDSEPIEEADLQADVYSPESCTITWCSSWKRPATCG